MNFPYSFHYKKGSDLSSSTDEKTLVSSSYSPSISMGRSSTESIPWAEDAIRHNQDEWIRIENIFYGEENLPTDIKLREEFLEWMDAFPHLRISGTQAPIYYNHNSKSQHIENQYYEEVIAIDPPRSKYGSKYYSRNPKNSEKMHNLNTDLTKYLKISPSPALKRRAIESSKESLVKQNPPYLFKIPQSHGVHLLNLKNPQTNLSLSASHVRMPPILNIKIMPTFHNTQRTNHVKSAVFGELKTRVTLPAIDVSKINYNNNVVLSKQDTKSSFIGRSISAAVCKKKVYDNKDNLERIKLYPLH